MSRLHPTLDGGPIQIQPGLPWAALEAGRPPCPGPGYLRIACQRARSFSSLGDGRRSEFAIKGQQETVHSASCCPRSPKTRSGSAPSPPPTPAASWAWQTQKVGTADSPHQEVRATWMGAEEVPGQLRPLPWGGFRSTSSSPAVSPRGSEGVEVQLASFSPDVLGAPFGYQGRESSLVWEAASRMPGARLRSVLSRRGTAGCRRGESLLPVPAPRQGRGGAHRWALPTLLLRPFGKWPQAWERWAQALPGRRRNTAPCVCWGPAGPLPRGGEGLPPG